MPSIDQFIADVDVEKHAKTLIDNMIIVRGEKQIMIEIDPKVESLSVLMQQMK